MKQYLSIVSNTLFGTIIAAAVVAAFVGFVVGLIYLNDNHPSVLLALWLIGILGFASPVLHSIGESVRREFRRYKAGHN